MRLTLRVVLVLVLITNATSSMGRAQYVPTWTAVEDLRIGSVDEPGSALGWFRDVAIGDDGSMYVPQDMEGRIRVFAADGSPLGTIGNRGEGPGEFQSIASVGWVGGRLYAYDYRARRLSFFTAGGDFIESKLLAPPGLAYPVSPGMGEPLADGTMLLYTATASSRIADGDVTRLPIIRLEEDGSIRDTTAWRPVGHGTWRVMMPEGGMSFTQPPWSDESIIAVTADRTGLIRVDCAAASSAREAEIVIERTDLSGVVEWRQVIPYTPIPLTEAEVDEFLESRVDRYVGSDSRFPQYTSEAKALKAMRAGLYVPRFLPPVSKFLQGRDGSLWIGRESRLNQPRTWLALDSEGNARGALELPAIMKVLAATADHIWTLDFDEFDVQYLVRLEIQKN